MNYKPLLTIIPCILVFLVFLAVDKPLPQPEAPVKQEREKSARNEEKSTESGPEEETTLDPEGPEIEEEEGPIKIDLVVGKTGSLKKGGFEPIYPEADESSEPIGKLEFNCTVIREEDQLEEGWVCVDLRGKGKGYVKEDHVEVVEASLGSSDAVRNKIVTDAMSYIGLRFARYGKSLTEGIDCSNFVQQIYKKNGIELPEKPNEQRDSGKIISEEERKAGDLIYYDKANNGYGHIGIYVGNGFIINSTGHSGKIYPEGGVRIVRLLYPDRTSYQVVSYLQEE